MEVNKTRLDLLLVERGLADSRSQAQRLVMAGQVRVDGQVVLRSAAEISRQSVLTLAGGPRFASRGGEKLEAALSAFDIAIAGKACADVGASTGGFTDCLLQHGARLVYAIDVGRGVLDWKLRQEARVVIMEDTNARYVASLPQPVEVVTIDVSFISLKAILPVVKGWLLPGEVVGESRTGTVIALVKPQFEAGRRQAGRGKGVIRDPAIHHQVLLEVLSFAIREGFALRGLIRSPLTGPKGNIEFLAWFEYPGGEPPPLADLVDQALSLSG